MSRRTLSLVALLCATGTAGSLAAAQVPDETTPNYQISYPNYQYRVTAASIGDVDFRNLTVFWYRDDKSRRSAPLLNGTFEEKYADGGGEKVTVDLVQSVLLPGETRRRAVIDLLWRRCGGSCSDHGLVQIFELRSGHPTVVEQITYERHAPNTGATVDTGSRTLTVTGRSSEPSANCCPKSLDVMTFEWNGRELAFKSSKRVALADTP